MKMSSFRSKPVGWRYESHRHYLASKGVKTKVDEVADILMFKETDASWLREKPTVGGAGKAEDVADVLKMKDQNFDWLKGRKPVRRVHTRKMEAMSEEIPVEQGYGEEMQE
jgi:hypothetical protein